MLHRRHIVGDLLNVVDGNTGHCFIFEQEQIRERRFGAFDLGRQKGFFTDIEVQKESGIRQECRQAIQPSEGLICPVEMLV